MKKYDLTCQYCGENFQSSRKNTKYCSDSCRVMASNQRKKEGEEENTEKKSVSVEFSAKEYAQLQDTAKAAGITVQEMVKYRSLVLGKSIELREKENETLKKEIAKLKAHLSLYTKKHVSGIFLPASKTKIRNIKMVFAEMFVLADEPDATLEDKILWLAENFDNYFDEKYWPWRKWL